MLLKDIRSVLLFLLIFTSSLYGYDLKIPIYIISLIFFFVFVSYNFHEIQLSKLVFVTFPISIFLIYALFFIEYISDYVSLESKEAIVGNLVLFLYTLLYISTAYVFFDKKLSHELEKPTFYVLLIHIVLFFLQFLTLIFGDYNIDFYGIFNSEGSRYINYIDEAVLTKYRATGLFVEPSTYCSVITCLLCIYISVTSWKKVKYWVVCAAILSMLVSFSSAAYILFVFILLSFFVVSKNKKTLMFIAILIAVIFLVFYSFFYEVIDKLTSTSESRFLLLQYLYSFRESWLYYFGYGPLGVEQFLYTSSVDGSRIFSSLNDVGLINYFVVHFGISGVVIPIFCLYKTKNNIDIFFLTVALFLTKITYSFPLFIIAIFCLFVNSAIPIDSKLDRSVSGH